MGRADMNKDGASTGSLASLEEMKLGVWRLLTEKEASLGFHARWRKMTNVLPTIQTFVADVYALGSGYLTLIALSKAWSSLEDVFLLHLSGRMLAIIEFGLKEGKPDTTALIKVVVTRILVVAMSALVESWSTSANAIMETRVTHHFEQRIFSAKVEADMPTSHDNNEDDSLTAAPAWDNFKPIIDITAICLQAFGLLVYIFNLAVSSHHGPIFVLLCVGKPVFRFFYRRGLWEKPFVVQAVNPTYIRLQALKKLEEDQYRQDIISGNIGEYILREHEEAQRGLEDVELSHPFHIYENRHSLKSTVLLDVAGDLTMLFYAANAVLNPDKFTLSTIAMLQHSESVLRRTFFRGTSVIRDITRGISYMKRMYKLCTLTNVIKDGTRRYPSTDQSDAGGMSLEMRNVSFSYPGGESNAKALDNVSFSVKSGQLVVLVGSNGSGKSTIVKLLARLYDPTSGQIDVDGRDISSYNIADLRAATASLTQDHHLYPLSLSENIGLGNSRRIEDVELITKAAQKGGAESFVAKLKDGFSTTLDPQTEWSKMHVQVSDGTPLAKEVEKLSKTTDISGGERQRVVASRTFMRFTTGAVKLVVADEGSSALDPEAEWELFKNLREERQGKTMVFVTHRFGHLTKYADIILCMKEGRLVESGTHEELMKIPEGEYAKLYDIQAKAFESGSDGKTCNKP